jgi:hypothetical protein
MYLCSQSNQMDSNLLPSEIPRDIQLRYACVYKSLHPNYRIHSAELQFLNHAAYEASK